ncbi:uncharacterized protein M6B38_385285 [Iris pallida]|uniref:Uncharacterized protein n=1 Tax=Iris pallida TaxID=29817 RepID=A0AAX6G3B1_IRIPA|nr:uncharacterized protein M6B38_385285 [Iris pallida]
MVGGGACMNKKMSSILKKCRSLSARLGRSSSYTNLRSMSARDVADEECADAAAAGGAAAVVFVGSSRRRYTISAKHLSHPLINALIDRPEGGPDEEENIGEVRGGALRPPAVDAGERPPGRGGGGRRVAAGGAGSALLVLIV